MANRFELTASLLCLAVMTAGCFNRPPTAPVVSGPTSGNAGSPLVFSAIVTDPEQDVVSCRFAWGNADTSDWGQPVFSGDTVLVTHSWAVHDTYEVRAQAMDQHGLESPWSAAYSVDIRALEGYPDTVAARIPVGGAPYGLCILPNNRYVYVAKRTGGISVISTTTKSVTETISPPSGSAFLTPTPDGQYVYVAMEGNDQVGVIRTSDNTLITTIPVGDGPHQIACTPDGSRMFVANYYDATVSVIRTSDNTVVANVSIPGEPWCVDVTPDGEFAYASGRSTDSVAVIRTSDNQVVAYVEAGREPGDIEFTPDGQYCYVSCRLDNDVAVIRTSDLQVVARIPGCSHPTGISMLADGSYAYLSNYYDDYVLVARTSDNVVVDTLQLGTTTDFSTVDRSRNEIYIGCPEQDEVWVISYR